MILLVTSEEHMDTHTSIKKAGRPKLPNALTPAQRQAKRREIARDRGIVPVTVELSAELVAVLDKFLQFKDLTKNQVIEAALRDRFMRKR